MTLDPFAAGVTFGGAVVIPSNAAGIYQEGTWVPADNSGASLVITVVYANFIRVGKQVTVYAFLQYPVNASAATVNISGLPFAAGSPYGIGGIFANAGTPVVGVVVGGTSTVTINNAATGAAVTNASLSGANVLFSITYTE